jgi:hypothetical protein
MPVDFHARLRSLHHHSPGHYLCARLIRSVRIFAQLPAVDYRRLVPSLIERTQVRVARVPLALVHPVIVSQMFVKRAKERMRLYVRPVAVRLALLTTTLPVHRVSQVLRVLLVLLRPAVKFLPQRLQLRRAMVFVASLVRLERRRPFGQKQPVQRRPTVTLRHSRLTVRAPTLNQATESNAKQALVEGDVPLSVTVRQRCLKPIAAPVPRVCSHARMAMFV